MPSIDVDEYIRFEGHSPKTSYSSEIARYTQRNDAVNHIFFRGKYDFRIVSDPSTEVDIASRHRGRKLAPHRKTKYVVRPDRVYTLFVHWPTSLVNGSRGLNLTSDHAVINHYRLLKGERHYDDATTDDTTLVSEAALVKKSMLEMYGSAWTDFSHELHHSSLSLIALSNATSSQLSTGLVMHRCNERNMYSLIDELDTEDVD